MKPRRVAACVVTGFLGSGKTTLLRGLLEREPGRERIAVIVNELGEIGIDGRVLTGFEFVENVVEMASGCVCCSIDEYRFDLAVDELVRRVDPLLVVLETTGVADPGPTLERLRRAGLGVDSVTCVVDARAWQAAWRVSATARRQIAAADFLVVTKGDLVGARHLERVRIALAKRNPRALVLEAIAGRPFPGAELLLATSSARQSALAASHPSADSGPDAGHLLDDAIESFSWQTSRTVDRHAFAKVVRGLPASILRAKGLFQPFGDRRTWIFHLVCGRFEMSVLPGGEGVVDGAQAVFLGPGIGSLREAVVARLASCESSATDHGELAATPKHLRDPRAG